MNTYATLEQLRRSLGLGAAQHADDDLLIGALEAASRLVERHTGRVFYPWRQVQVYTCSNPTALLLRDDLLVLHDLINGDGTTIPAEAARLCPANEAVRSSIVLNRSQAAFTYIDEPLDAITVDGTWGFHPEWDTAWAPSGDTVQDAALDADTPAITVADADGALPGSGEPRFSVGRLLRIGEEYLHIRAVDTSQNRLTVTRGANGTAASAHPQGSAIELYLPPDDVRQACLRVAAWLYKQRDAGYVQAAGALRGQIVVPPALPEDAAQILGPLVRVRVA